MSSEIFIDNVDELSNSVRAKLEKYKGFGPTLEYDGNDNEAKRHLSKIVTRTGKGVYGLRFDVDVSEKLFNLLPKNLSLSTGGSPQDINTVGDLRGQLNPMNTYWS